MGVYADIKRHDGQNPGVFTILMNQDYIGLNAEIGILSGGTWRTYPMTYGGRKDGNSVWKYTPAQTFPAGETVTYYFHGFDGSGGHIWDSNNAQNYSFSASEPVLSFGTPGTLNANFIFSQLDACAAGSVGFLGIQGDATAYGIRPTEQTDWTLSLLAGGSSNRFGDVATAANQNTGLLVTSISNQLVVTRFNLSSGGSAPQGSQRITISGMMDFQYVAEIAASAWGDSGFVIAFSIGSSGVHPDGYTMRSLDQGQTWSAPVKTFTSDYGVSPIQVGWNGQSLVLVHKSFARYLDALHVRTSTDGLTWNDTVLTNVIGGGSSGQPALIASPNHTLVATVGNSAREISVWRLQGGSWSRSATPMGTLSNVAGATATDLPDGRTALFIQTWDTAGTVKALVSADHGLTWPASTMVSHPSTNNPRLIKAFTVGSTVNLLWHRWGPNGDESKGYVQTATMLGPKLQWLGNTYHWPEGSVIDAGREVQVNCQSWPKNAGKVGFVAYSTNGTTWSSRPLSKGAGTDNNDTWSAGIGAFLGGATVQYAVSLSDDRNTQLWDTRGGRNYSFTTYAPSMKWLGNIWHWPSSNPGTNDDVWINGETWPAGSASDVYVVYNVSGTSDWISRRLTHDGIKGNNDGWHLNLGKFAAGKEIQYAIVGFDMNGANIWARNGGNNYRISVSNGIKLTSLNVNNYGWSTSCGRCMVNNTLTISISAGPANSMVYAAVVYSVDGGSTWSSVDVAQSSEGFTFGQAVISFDPNTVPSSVRFAVMGRDSLGNTIWNNNGGRDYTTSP